MRKAWITAVVDAAMKDAGTAFKPSTSKHWNVLSSADAGFTKKAVAAAEAMRAWMTQKMPDLVKDAPQPAVLRRQGPERIYNIRVTSEASSAGAQNFVVTLDDITELVSAQRTSAWADVDYPI